MRSFGAKKLALAGLIAAVYTTLSLVFLPISFSVYQIRVAEALTVLPFVSVAAIPGLFVGCMAANLFGGMGWQDVVLGSLLTLVAAILTRQVSRLNISFLNRSMAWLPAVLMASGGLAILKGERFDFQVAGLTIGSLVLAVLAARLGTLSPPRRPFVIACGVGSLALLAGVAWLAVPQVEAWSATVGLIALVAAVALAGAAVYLGAAGENPALLLAPMPPVILNALGVSLYLAPIMGVDYWFSVQMVGVGQLISCYLLGLPLLRLVRKRRWLVESI